MDDPKNRVATREEEVAFTRRFFPHLCERPKRRSVSVRKAIEDQYNQAITGPEASAKALGKEMIVGLLEQGWNPGIAVMQAQARSFTKRPQLVMPDFTKPTPTPVITNKNPTPGLRNMVRRQFGLPPDEK